nr:reverse transcriptase domain-containing protein [Tanacetum cinerariifolium]
IVPLFDTMLEHQGEGSGTLTEPHHTPSPEVDTSHPTTSSIPLPSIPTAPIPPVTQPDTTPIRQYSKRARIAQSSTLSTVADEPDRATIAKSSTLPHDSAPKVTSPAADEGSVPATQSGDDAPIKGRSINEREAAAERISNDSKEIARVLTSIDVATVLEGGIDVPIGSSFIPTAGPPATVISTGSEVARELEEQQEKENMKMNEHIARDAEVVRIHVEEELQGMIDSLDKSNETIAKYLQEYQDFASELPLKKRIELINDLVKYQDNYSKVYNFQSQQRRPMTKKQKREYYMDVIKSNLGWRVKDSKEQEQVKKQKSSEEAPQIETSTKEFTEEKIKEMMQLVPVEDVYVQAFQFKHPIIDWKELDREDLNQLWALVKEYLSIRPAISDKEMELWVELKRMYKPDPEDQLWTLTQNFMHAPVEWKLYDLKKVVATARRLEMPLPEVCTAIEEKKKKLPFSTLLSKTTREALKIIESKSKVHYSRSKSNDARVNTNSRDNSSKIDDIIDKLEDQILNLVEIVNKQVIISAIAKAVEKTCVICGGAHAYYDCIATDSNQPSVCAATSTTIKYLRQTSCNQIPPPGFAPVQDNQNRGDFNKQEENLRRNLNNDTRSILGSFFQNKVSTLGTLSSNTVPNPKGKMKAVTTRSGLAYEGPSIPTNSPIEKVVERDTEETKNKEHSNCQGSTAHIQSPGVSISIPEPDKFFQIFHELHFDISFADALLLMPKFASTNKSLLTNKDKLFELEKVSLNENCSAMLLKKLPKKLVDIDKFLIPCDFLGIDVCHALADLDASINLMPLSIWKKLSLPKLTPTRMTLELVDRSITRPKGVSEDVFIEVGKFHFPTDFVVVDFKADPRVPLILGRSFLRTGRALIDVYKEEITLRVNDESVTFNLNQTMRYSLTYDDNSVNRVDVIDIACEEFVQDVLDFQYNSKSSNPTLVSNPSFSEEIESEFCKKPIFKSSSPTLTPFGESDFFLEEIGDFLNDESIPTGIENYFYDPEGGILYLEKLLNEDPFQFLPTDLKQAEETKAKSSIEESPELELKELPSHLEYAFLEESDKLPIIIAKNLKDVEKEALIKEDYKLAVQTQTRVNPKIHDVIKKEVIKLLDVGMIYLISYSPWMSPIHCVPKKGGMTVVANENNELIPTRLVTGWRVCIDYRKFNDATQKDHFSLPFMDQILERLAENELYCFLDGFSGYFQIPIDPQDQEKETFTCPYRTFAYRRMPFGLCNALGTFQRCMITIFHDMIEKTMEVFMDDFSVFAGSFSSCLSNLDKMLKRCEDTNLVLNWEKCHFMCKEGIVLGHKILKSGTKVDRAKVDVIANLPHPTTVKGVRSFLVLRQQKTKHFQPTHYASKTMTEAQIHYTTTEKEMLAVVYAFEKFRPYLVLSKSIVYTDHSALKYLLRKQDEKPRLENPHKDVSENKDINENFPLETLGSLSSGSTSCLTSSNEWSSGGFQSRIETHFREDCWENHTLWSDKLDDALWAFRTAFKTPIGCTPYKMVYEKSCHLPIKLEHKVYWALKHVNFDLKTAGDHWKLQPNELNELRDQAYENSLIYKERTKKLHDSKIKNHIFNVGDQVLLFNSRLKIFSRKLKTRWSGPFTITQVFSYGTVELSQPNGPNFKVNGHRVKHYFEGDIPSNVVPDLHTFPMEK